MLSGPLGYTDAHFSAYSFAQRHTSQTHKYIYVHGITCEHIHIHTQIAKQNDLTKKNSKNITVNIFKILAD